MTESQDRDISVLGPDTDVETVPRRYISRASEADDAHNRKFAIDSAKLLIGLHCTDIVIFDVRTLSEVTDYILIASGTSDRQIRSVGVEVNKLAKERGIGRFGHDADDASTWIVLDFIDLIVHLFEPSTRAHYDLEMMWGDAPKINWRED